MASPPPTGWQSAFAAVTLALSDGADAVREGMSEEDFRAAAEAAPALVDPRREVRARGIAVVIARLIADVDAVRLC